jgi:hypothetical protein
MMTARGTKRWGHTTWAVAVVVVLLGAGCSNPAPPRYEVTAVFDEITKPTLPDEERGELRLLGVAPDGTLYIETEIIPDLRQDVRTNIMVRLPTGAYAPPPVELDAEWIQGMAFDPASGDVFVLSFPQGRAQIRRFHGDRVVQDVVPTKPQGGNFEENRKAGGDEVGLFYDASSGSLLYADGSLYRIDATGTATVALSKPALPEGHVAANGDADRDNRVAYAVNPRTGAVYVAFTDFSATVKCTNRRGAVYRVEAGGRLSHVAGGCFNGDDDYIDGGPYRLAADSTSDDLVTTGPLGAVNWISKGKSTRVDFPDEFGRVDPVRGVGFDAAGDAYVGADEKVAKITFRR